MAKFLTPLYLMEVTDTEFEIATTAFVYESDLLSVWVSVPVGFRTDFASIPRWGWIYSLLGNTAHKPAVIHDYLYYTGEYSRKTADDVLREAMEVDDIVAWRRFAIYYGVRLGGWWAWRQHRKAKHGIIAL